MIYKLNIENQKYQFNTLEDLEVGDNSTLNYLPKSRGVLKWECVIE